MNQKKFCFQKFLIILFRNMQLFIFIRNQSRSKILKIGLRSFEVKFGFLRSKAIELLFSVNFVSRSFKVVWGNSRSRFAEKESNFNIIKNRQIIPQNKSLDLSCSKNMRSNKSFESIRGQKGKKVSNFNLFKHFSLKNIWHFFIWFWWSQVSIIHS